jgi:ligand-binding sensor domain-containing protein/two-component sensor histidine kinase
MKLLPWLLFFTSCCVAQESLRFKHITRENGSSITGVQNFYQDSEGYLWMASATADLIRFDGTNFRYYGYTDFETDRISGSRGTLVFEDSKQQLWVGTDVGWLFRYDRIKDQLIAATDSSQSAGARIFCFAEAPDGSFWLGSLGGGLIKFHPETKTFRQYKAERGNPNTLPDNFISGLSYDADGTLWVGTTGGLCSYDSKTDQFINHPLSNVNPDDTYKYRVIRNLHISGNKIYLSTYGGLQIFDRIHKTSQHLIHVPDKKSLNHNSLFRVAESSDGKLWIATYGGGLNQFDPVTQTFMHWKNDAFTTESISSNNLFSVYLDTTGLLWIGAADNTVSVLNTAAKKFYRVKSNAAQPDGISHGWVRTLLQENDSVFWLGFNGQGLNKLNLNTGSAEKFTHHIKNSNSLSHNAVSGLSKDLQGNLWMALEGGGINKINTKTKKITRFLAGKNSINNNAISALLVDSENLLWATAYRSGLNLLDLRTNKVTQINNDSLQAASGISLEFVDGIFELNGNIWFNGQNQVVVFDKKYNRFVKVAETGRVAQLDNSFTLEIKPYSETEMLLVTKDEARAIRYISPDSIPSERLFKMNAVEGLKSFVVQNKEVWYVTYNQLVRWNPQQNKKHTYTRADGIATDELNSIYKDKQGRIFVTSKDGFNWFYPDQIVNDTLSRKIVLTDFKLFNHSATQKPDSVYRFSLDSQPSKLKLVNLNHNHNFFSIEFAAQEFIAPEKIQYAYRLTGFDKDWVHVGNRTFASYTNLDPGTYLFEVKATNPDGYWGNDFATLTLIIHPPFWRTWWFMLLVLLASGAFIYAIHRYQLTQSLKLERLRTKIASDLHDEVGSSLTKISIYSELVQNGIHEKEKTNYLQSIGSLSREVVSTMSDIVWSIDNNNDTLAELINRMKDFATEVFEAKGIDFEFMLHKTEGNKILEPIVRQSIYLIFKEAINNVVKHAGATHVKVSITTHPYFELGIEDNGIGLPEQQSQTGNGLRNMKRRAESIGGTLTFLAASGTTVTLQVK